MTMHKKRALKLLNSYPNQRLLIVGDLMLDRYVYGDVSRISPEAPVPVVRVSDERDMPGGAGNVAINVCALGGRACAAGVVGADKNALRMRKAFERGNVSCRGVLSSENSHTPVKSRVVADRQQIVRVDRESDHLLSPTELSEFQNLLREEISQSDAVVIEDYGKGSLTQAIVDTIKQETQKRGIPLGYDPKAGHPLQLKGLSLATPNRMEVFSLAGISPSEKGINPLEDTSLLSAAETLASRWDSKLLMVTLGSEGMLLLEEGREARHISTRSREVFDVSGAGDTVVAATMLALASGATPMEAAELANFAAGVVVGKLGTATCNREELLEFMGNFCEESQ